MASIEDLKIGCRVTAYVDGQLREGTIVGRRIKNRIEGYVTPTNNICPAPEQGDDMVQVSFPKSSQSLEWVTIGLLCKPERLSMTETESNSHD
ncbi:hypothetical protein [Acidithiobacillus sp.]